MDDLAPQELIDILTRLEPGEVAVVAEVEAWGSAHRRTFVKTRGFLDRAAALFASWDADRYEKWGSGLAALLPGWSEGGLDTELTNRVFLGFIGPTDLARQGIAAMRVRVTVGTSSYHVQVWHMTEAAAAALQLRATGSHWAS